MNLSEVHSGHKQVPTCPCCPLSANLAHSPRTVCDPVHDHRKRGGSDGFLDHAIFGGTTAFRRHKQVVQAMSTLRLFKCWLVMIDRALLQPTVRAAA